MDFSGTGAGASCHALTGCCGVLIGGAGAGACGVEEGFRGLALARHLLVAVPRLAGFGFAA